MASQKTFYLLAIIFSFVGLGLLGGSIYSFITTKNWLSESYQSNGKVIDLVERESTDSDGYRSITYAPVVEYQFGEETFVFESSVSSDPPSHKVGQYVNVRYDPKNPNDAKIDSFFSLWFLTIILGLLGVIFTIVGGGLLIIPNI